MMLRTPFAPRNFASGDDSMALEVCGYAAPIEIAGFEHEYRAVREGASLYDFSMLHKFDVRGRRAIEVVNAMVVRDLERVRPGRIAYGPVVDERGTMLDDSTCMVLGPDHVRVTGGALLPAAIAECVDGRNGVTVDAFRERVFQLNVQGPRSRELIERLTDDDISNAAFPYYTHRSGVVIAGIECFVARMGFTGELGFEIWGPVDRALDMWDRLGDAAGGLPLAGAGAVTVVTVRTEAGMVMGDGLDYDTDTSPWECNLGWAVPADKRGYRGCEALLAARDTAPHRTVTVRLDAEAPDDVSMSPLFHGDDEVGRLNLAVSSPLAGSTLAMSKVRREASAVGTGLIARTGHGDLPGVIVATPLHDPERRRVRG